MTARLAFTIPGTPFAKGRPRATARAFINDLGKPQAIVSVYTPAKTREGEAAITKIAKAVMKREGRVPTTAPIKLRVLCVFAPAPSWTKRMREAAVAGHVVHVQKPDFDNLSKVIDALNSVVWVDDCQITDASISKRFGAVARTDIVIEWVDMTDKFLPPSAARAEAVAKAPKKSPFDKPISGDLFTGRPKR